MYKYYQIIFFRTQPLTRLITINIDGHITASTGTKFKDQFIPKDKLSVFSNQTDLGLLAADLAKDLKTEKFSYLPAIVRGLEMSPYWTTTDDREDGFLFLSEIQMMTLSKTKTS